MKSPRRFAIALLSFLMMIVCILDSKTVIAGAADGVTLCIRTVIPSLFPFLAVSGMLTGAVRGSTLLRPLGRILRIPSGAEPLLLIGLLGGYPTGAQAIAQACSDGRLSRSDAYRMLGYCSNAGPAFLFGMAGSLFISPGIPWLLWGIHIVSAIITGLIIPGKPECPATGTPSTVPSVSTVMKRSLEAMVSICGWVIVFRVLLAIGQRWLFWYLPTWLQTACAGILELSNGCIALSALPLPGQRLILCSLFLGFGSICVWLQTVSVTAGLGTGMYLPGKLMQSCISVLLAAASQYFVFPAAEQMTLSAGVLTALVLFPIGMAVYLRKKKNTSGNPVTVGV